MKYPYLKHLIFLVSLTSSFANAGVYIELSPAQLTIDTPADSTKPAASTKHVLADFRLGYQWQQHQLELAYMSSQKEDSLNQLTVEATSVQSIFYHYAPYEYGSLKFTLILGASEINTKSTYPGKEDSTDRFYGVSYGLGLAESFKSLPELKVKFNWIQLYRGDQLKIDVMTLGLGYAF